MSSKKQSTQGKKQQVQELLLKHCKNQNNYEFDNDLVKKFASQVGFRNPFDATKSDSSEKLAKFLRDEDYFILHLGEGKHKFVQGIAKGYHKFEDIDSKDVLNWPYKSSILNESDTSESNILSVAFNQKITHHFLYGKKDVEANVYQARRTQADIAYRVGAEQITARKVQMEIDQTFEYGAVVTIIEAKNGFPRDFAVYQLHHPCLFFTNQKTRFGIQSVQCCYLLREKQEQQSILRLYLYKFADPKDMTSIALAKSAEYRLQKK